MERGEGEARRRTGLKGEKHCRMYSRRSSLYNRKIEKIYRVNSRVKQAGSDGAREVVPEERLLDQKFMYIV